MKVLRNLFSLILPVAVLIGIPALIEPDLHCPSITATIIGSLTVLSGLFILIMTIRMFIMIGKGTLAPWDPTRKLVTASLYAHFRNPMISSVNAILFGEALLFFSFHIFLWAILFFIINNIYFIILEEPGLERRFGHEYIEYKKNVPRWILRLKPWSPKEMAKEDK